MASPNHLKPKQLVNLNPVFCRLHKQECANLVEKCFKNALEKIE